MCTSNTKFSVAMSVYSGDEPEWLKAAIESILNQTLPPAEVVIVVDGPISEGLKQVINEYVIKPEFIIVQLPENTGHGFARSIALNKCNYDIVALMDTDDICCEYRFEKQMSVLENDESISVVGGQISEFIGEPNNIVSYRRVPLDDEKIKRYMKNRCPMNQVTVMFRKSSVQSVGGYKTWPYDEDYYLWIRMAQAGLKFANVPDVIVNVRTGEEQYSRRGGTTYFASEARLQKYMLDNKMISFPRFAVNIIKRFIIQIICPSKMRGWLFRKFARQPA